MEKVSSTFSDTSTLRHLDPLGNRSIFPHVLNAVFLTMVTVFHTAFMKPKKKKINVALFL